MVIDAKERRCTDCSKHSGIVAEIDAGRGSMKRLEKAISDLKLDFSSHIKAQAVRTITILILVVSTLLTGFVSIYVSSIKSNDQYDRHTEMSTLAKEIIQAIREEKK